MYSLFIDTHDKNIILGLYKDGVVTDSRNINSGLHHSDLIMPSIKELLDNNKLSPNDLNEILVVNGPGSFTGVRLGVTIAKTFAYILNISIKTITSLEVMMVSNGSVLPIIRDVKGVFGCVFKNHLQLGDYFYKSNEEFKDFVSSNKLEVDELYNVDFNKVYEYMKDKESINPHQVNPIYIKVIEVLKDDKTN